MQESENPPVVVASSTHAEEMSISFCIFLRRFEDISRPPTCGSRITAYVKKGDNKIIEKNKDKVTGTIIKQMF